MPPITGQPTARSILTRAPTQIGLRSSHPHHALVVLGFSTVPLAVPSTLDGAREFGVARNGMATVGYDHVGTGRQRGNRSWLCTGVVAPLGRPSRVYAPTQNVSPSAPVQTLDGDCVGFLPLMLLPEMMSRAESLPTDRRLTPRQPSHDCPAAVDEHRLTHLDPDRGGFTPRRIRLCQNTVGRNTAGRGAAYLPELGLPAARRPFQCVIGPALRLLG